MSSELHHRSHEQLINYWNKIKGSKNFPQESDIDPEVIADIWASCFLVAIDEVALRVGYKYSYLGEELIAAYGDEVRNPEVATQLISTANPNITKKISEVVQTQKPMTDESEFINSRRIKIRYRTCLLPLGYPEKVTHVLGCMRWKIY